MSEEEVKVVEQVPSNVNESPTDGDKKKTKKPKSKARIIIEWILTIVFAGLFIFAGIGQINGMVNKKNNYNQTLPYGYGSFVVWTDSMEPEYKVNTAIITHKDSADSILKSFIKPNTGHLVLETIDSRNHHIKTYQALWEGVNDKEHKHVDLTFAYVPCSYASPIDSITYNNQTNLNPPSELVGLPMTHRVFEIQVDEDIKLGDGRYLFFTAGINPEGNQSNPGQYQAFSEKELLGVVILNSAFLGAFFSFISSPWGLLVFLLIPAFYLVISSVLDIFKTMKDNEEAEEKEAASGSGNANRSLDSLSKEDKERLKKEMLDEMMNKKGKK